MGMGMSKKYLFFSSAYLLGTLIFMQGCVTGKNPEVVSIQESIESENAYLWKNAPEQVNKAKRFLEIAENMEKRGDYDLATEFLLHAINEPFLMANFETILSMTQNRIDLLSQANKRTNPSLFVPPDEDGVWDTLKKNKIASIVTVLGGMQVTMFGSSGLPGLTALGGGALWLNRQSTLAQRDAVRAIYNTTIDRTTARNIIERYDYLKRVISLMETKITAEIVATSSDIDALVALLQKVKIQKDIIRKNRTDYLSYEVISPILFEVNRQLFLADNDYLAMIGKDKETLDSAVKLLAFACHEDWLYQTEESVREQFIDTQHALKSIASQAESDEYKVVTTLSDSIDPSKKRGVDAWW